MSYTTPDLPYSYGALEPLFDETTMRIHHDKHHVGYTTKLNAAIEGTAYAGEDPVELLKKLDSLPENLKAAVRNNGGGHVNHSLFWKILQAPAKGENRPSGKLAEAVEKDLGGFEAFKKAFSGAAATRFGSGWAWLVFCCGKLEVSSTANQDSPYSQGAVPLLGLDVWEHAYYLKYQNRRPDYIEAFFSLINWEEVGRNFEAASA